MGGGGGHALEFWGARVNFNSCPPFWRFRKNFSIPPSLAVVESLAAFTVVWWYLYVGSFLAFFFLPSNVVLVWQGIHIHGDIIFRVESSWNAHI